MEIKKEMIRIIEIWNDADVDELIVEFTKKVLLNDSMEFNDLVSVSDYYILIGLLKLVDINYYEYFAKDQIEKYIRKLDMFINY